ncbi:MAG: hypothetical protein L0177_00090 [Chloroflexi bacterium]|nr:hypothetical protein [Chloroflexota bacterium]
MPKLSLYVSEDVAAKVRKKAEGRGISISRYLAGLVRRDIGAGWPEDFFEKVVGSWQGEPLERPPQGEFERRDEL